MNACEFHLLFVIPSLSTVIPGGDPESTGRQEVRGGLSEEPDTSYSRVCSDGYGDPSLHQLKDNALTAAGAALPRVTARSTVTRKKLFHLCEL